MPIRKQRPRRRRRKRQSDFLSLAEFHLRKAVELKEISPRPHNNLGRVLLRRSQQRESKANEPEAKVHDAEAKLHDAETRGKTDAKVAAEIPQLKAELEARRKEAAAAAADSARLLEEAKVLRTMAIAQFDRAVELDPTLLEARLNLGEVYIQTKEYDKAIAHYNEILKLYSESVKDPDAKANFSQASLGLARIAIETGKADQVVPALMQGVQLNPNNIQALQILIDQLYLRQQYHDADRAVWMWLSKLAAPIRAQAVEQFINARFEATGKLPQAVRMREAAAWLFATSGEPQLRNPQAALYFAERTVKMTNQQDPLAIDAYAAAAAINGRFDIAVQAAQQAIALANAQGNRPLAEAIARRLEFYQRQSPYQSDPSGSDRP